MFQHEATRIVNQVNEIIDGLRVKIEALEARVEAFLEAPKAPKAQKETPVQEPKGK